MFHMAPPLVFGLGVRISTPGFARSAQSRICFGLPLRTAKATIEVLTMPLVGVAFQSWVISPAFTMRSMSASSDRAATSASNPSTIARDWAPEPRYDSWKVTSWPVCCFQRSLNMGISLP